MEIEKALKTEDEQKRQQTLGELSSEIKVTEKNSQQAEKKLASINEDLNSVGRLENLIQSKTQDSKASDQKSQQLFDLLPYCFDKMKPQITKYKYHQKEQQDRSNFSQRHFNLTLLQICS